MHFKKSVVAAAFLFSITGIGSASADAWGLSKPIQEGPMLITKTNPIRAADNSVGIAATGTLMNYQENITPGPSDIESGWMPGFAVSGSYLNHQNVYLALRYAYDSGSIQYLGADIGSGNKVTATDNATTQRLLGRIGYAFWLNPSMSVTPYAAAGFQSWNRDLTGPGGYTEDYRSILAGVGGRFQYAYGPRLVLTANAEMLAVTGGGMTPHLDNLPLGSARFGTSGEEKIALGANYRISGPWSVFGGLDFTHFNYTGGALKYGFSEPSSSTNRFGMDLGVAYHF